MSNLRRVGMIVALALSLLSFRIFLGQKWNRADFFLFAASGLFLLALSLNPGLITILRRKYGENKKGGNWLTASISPKSLFEAAGDRRESHRDYFGL